MIPEFLIALFTVTGGIVWILAFAYLVGYIHEKASS